MRFMRLQTIFIALIILSFIVCMILSIAIVSDINVLNRVFGQHRVDVVPKIPDDLSLLHENDLYVTYGARASLLSQHNNSRVGNRSVIMNVLQNRYTSAIDVNPSTLEDSLPNYDVHIFYYPWYGNPAFDGVYLHWNHRILPHWKPEVSSRYAIGQRYQPPDDVASSFYPRLGPYSSRDPLVIADHMRQIRQSGAGVISVSWYPPGQADDEGKDVDSVMPLLLDAAEKQQLKVCFHIEPYKDRTAASLRSNLSYIISRYGNHSAFYRHPTSNLPLYYIYDSYLVPSAQWMALLGRHGGPKSVRQTELDGIFLGLVVDRPHFDELIRSSFDGFYTYFASDRFTYGSTHHNWASLAALARNSQVLFVPSVGPGYVDVRIRPWNPQNIRNRKHGEYFERAFSAAIESQPVMISVTSFNEWHEGSQIEEAIPKQTDNFRYDDYGPGGTDFYLKLSRRWTSIFARQKRSH